MLLAILASTFLATYLLAIRATRITDEKAYAGIATATPLPAPESQKTE
jgi:hypothetical protein